MEPKTQTLDAQPEPVIAKGKRLIMVDETFDDLMYWLERCDEKGHLENCSDLIRPWSNFSYTNAPEPVQREWVGLDQSTVYALFYCDLDQSFTDFASAIEQALKERNQ
jgi:hypothetical protein